MLIALYFKGKNVRTCSIQKQFFLKYFQTSYPESPDTEGQLHYELKSPDYAD